MQLVWNTAVDDKLHSIKSILGEWRPAFRADRKEEGVLARLRIGHSFITHSYLLKGEEQPTCVPCDTPFTIKHILLHCVDFQNSRDKYYKVNTLKELFETVEIHNISSIKFTFKSNFKPFIPYLHFLVDRETKHF